MSIAHTQNVVHTLCKKLVLCAQISVFLLGTETNDDSIFHPMFQKGAFYVLESVDLKIFLVASSQAPTFLPPPFPQQFAALSNAIVSLHISIVMGIRTGIANQ